MKYFFIFLIRIYQIVISPFLGKSCMFEPTCSEYSRIAFQRHGVMKGFYLTIKRIARCHPWQQNFGVDPVPVMKNASKSFENDVKIDPITHL